MFTRFQNLLRGCLLTVGVANRRSTVVVPEPIAQPIATNVDDAPDATDQLTAWEQDRAVTLHDADESEQRGLRLLKRSVLLRLVVQFEDEGLFVAAQDLRQKADNLEAKSVPELEFAAPTF